MNDNSLKFSLLVLNKLYLIMDLKTILALLCPLLVVSCGKESLPISPERQDDMTVSFLGNIGPSTRATDSNFETGDAIGVFAIEKTSSNPDGDILTSNHADNVKYSYSGGSFKEASTVIKQITFQRLMFYKAIYPYTSSARNEFTFSVKTNQSYGDYYTLSDLMTADTEATTEVTPHLVFSHKLSNIIINLKYEEKPGGSEQMFFNNVLVEAKANINENTFTAFGTTKTVIASGNGNNSFKVILPPQTIAEKVTLITLKVGSKTFTFFPESDFIWKSGMQYTYDVTVSKAGIISFTSSINPWETDN